MIRSKDGVIEIIQGENPSAVVFPAASWSVINIPTDAAQAKTLFNHIYDTVNSRSVMLAVCRYKRKDRVQAVKNLPAEPWNYLETVSIWYERPSTCSNNGFLPISEPAWVFYKGDAPDTKRTAWFSAGDYNNATNLWNVAPQPEEKAAFIYYQKFSWELNLLLMNLADPLEHKKFIYTLPLDLQEQMSLFSFCHKYGIGAVLYSESHEESADILRNYSKFLESK